MKISVWKRPYWKVWGEKWISIHTNHCFCSLRRCKAAQRGKDYISGWSVYIGSTVVSIDRRKPKECLAPF
jgi:hypothetical protein